MDAPSNPLPLTASAVVDTYFMEHRAKLLDIAAFLDRVDRATPDGGGADKLHLARSHVPLRLGHLPSDLPHRCVSA